MRMGNMGDGNGIEYGVRERKRMRTNSVAGKLPIVNDKFEIVALASRDDLRKHRDFPHATKSFANKRYFLSSRLLPLCSDSFVM